MAGVTESFLIGMGETGMCHLGFSKDIYMDEAVREVKARIKRKGAKLGLNGKSWLLSHSNKQFSVTSRE